MIQKHKGGYTGNRIQHGAWLKKNVGFQQRQVFELWVILSVETKQEISPLSKVIGREADTGRILPAASSQEGVRGAEGMKAGVQWGTGKYGRMRWNKKEHPGSEGGERGSMGRQTDRESGGDMQTEMVADGKKLNDNNKKKDRLKGVNVIRGMKEKSTRQRADNSPLTLVTAASDQLVDPGQPVPHSDTPCCLLLQS
ncbi:unnamed protein product [Pleuronectes platessa]|uniref:Uncharacterized protein n=1 Tax=Pleuronectes platessa TaxID=8262 RepID=A0A9N7U8E1_PLEPL|nr:unnamed protein product [Pleuronectes platessa]